MFVSRLLIDALLLELLALLSDIRVFDDDFIRDWVGQTMSE